MKYSIISITDKRDSYKNEIRSALPFEEVDIPSYDGRAIDISRELDLRGMQHSPGLTEAEFGIWFSHWDRWEWAWKTGEDLVVFEDDAVLAPNFMEKFNGVFYELPYTYDYLSLWVPENQLIDYLYDVEYTEDGHMVHRGPNKNMITSRYNCGMGRCCKAYQGYGMVAMVYSPTGGKKLMDLSIDTNAQPVDCQVHLWAHRGMVNGYAPKPNYANIVAHDWDIPSTRIGE